MLICQLPGNLPTFYAVYVMSMCQTCTGVFLNPERMDGRAEKVLHSPCWTGITQKDKELYALLSDWDKCCCQSQGSITESTVLTLLFLTYAFKNSQGEPREVPREIPKITSKQCHNKASKGKEKVEKLTSFLSEQNTIKCSNNHANKMGRN